MNTLVVVFSFVAMVWQVGYCTSFTVDPANVQKWNRDFTNSTASQVEYHLFTRKNANNSRIVTSASIEIDHAKPIVILMHGWGGNADIDYIRAIKNAYLKIYDWNVISVDFSVYVGKDYVSAFSLAPSIARSVTNFICALKTPAANLHVVGHSLGGQIAGLVGKATTGKCGKIGRITGLDPAGPLYQDVHVDQRLDASDAALVDIIHTNQGMYGYVGDCGTVDFYPNCGFFQPGCLKNITVNDNIFKSSLPWISCQHQRSCYLFAESIINDNFYSTSCLNCGKLFCTNRYLVLPGTTSAYMGESCRKQPLSNRYVLFTNNRSPYALT